MAEKKLSMKVLTALKYLMCSVAAEEPMAKGEAVALKYLMCSREAEMLTGKEE